MSAATKARASEELGDAGVAHPDHDLVARRSRAWDRHWRNAERLAAIRGELKAHIKARKDAAAPAPEVPFWEPGAVWHAINRAASRHVEAKIADAVEAERRGAFVDLIDAMAVAVRRIEAGDPAAARDRLERALDETFSGWRSACPW
jgi:hypothetical protein